MFTNILLSAKIIIFCFSIIDVVHHPECQALSATTERQAVQSPYKVGIIWPRRLRQARRVGRISQDGPAAFECNLPHPQ